MTMLLSAFFILSGAVICLIAALGVLRLPDFFLRMHAATKAGVAGAGLVLIGVAFAEPSLGMWAKVLLAIAFLLLTTPVAGHLLARAGYVAGVPLWGGTYQDDLSRELRRGKFEHRPARADQHPGREKPRTESVLVALVSGHSGEAATAAALDIAKTSGRPLIALAIVDTKMLTNVGPVPIGGNHYAAQLRRAQIEKARHALAEVVQSFEGRARIAGVPYSIAMEEGDPVKIIRSRMAGTSGTVIARDGWFDHGIGGARSDPLQYLVRRGIHPLIGVSAQAEVRSVTFIHDGTPHSDRTLDWLLAQDPWPHAIVHFVPDQRTKEQAILAAKKQAEGILGDRLAKPDKDGIGLARSQVVVFGNEGHAGWINSMSASSRPGLNDVPIVVFG